VTSKGADASLLGTVIPDLAGRVDGTRDEETLRIVDSDRHDVTLVISEHLLGLSVFDVPEDQRSITGRGNDFTVVDEATAGEVTFVVREFTVDLLDGGFSRGTTFRELVEGADVVETTASDVVTSGGESAGHDPRGTERDSVELVGGPSVPDQELAVLRSGDELLLDDSLRIRSPVHGIDLTEVTLEDTTGLELEVGTVVTSLVLEESGAFIITTTLFFNLLLDFFDFLLALVDIVRHGWLV